MKQKLLSILFWAGIILSNLGMLSTIAVSELRYHAVIPAMVAEQLLDVAWSAASVGIIMVVVTAMIKNGKE